MRGAGQRRSALIAMIAVAWLTISVPQAATGARIEGLVRGVDGRPAADHTILLIDPSGAAGQRAQTDAGGLYRFHDLPAGVYAMGIESPQGGLSPVVAPPVRVGDGQLARRDLKLMETDPTETERAASSQYGIRLWWAGLDKWAKIGTIVGLVAGAVLVGKSLDSDAEQASSPSAPR